MNALYLHIEQSIRVDLHADQVPDAGGQPLLVGPLRQGEGVQERAVVSQAAQP